MHGLPDPASEDQAILVNAPFWIDGLNFGDVVRVGPPDGTGVRPIVEVLVASGHVRVMAVTGRHGIDGVFDALRSAFPHYALKIEGDGTRVLSVSVHPDLDPDDVLDAIAEWLDDHGALDDEDVAFSPPIRTELGPIQWRQR
jgi:hypothetical protein